MKVHLLFSITIISSTVNAAAFAMPLFAGYKPGISSGNYIGYGDYTDIRVLDVSRQGIAFWSVKKGSISIEQFFKNGQLQEVRIEDVTTESIKAITYKVFNGKLKLAYAAQRPILKMNFDLLDEKLKQNKCELWSDSVSKMKGLSLDLDSTVCAQNLDQIIIDPICKTILPPEEYRSLKKSYVRSLNLVDGQTRDIECLKRKETKSIFAKAYKVTDLNDLQTQLEILQNKYAYNTSLFYNAPEKLAKKITCDWSETTEPIATTDSTGRTVWHRKKGSSPNDLRSDKLFEKAAAHELWHGSSVLNEKSAQNLVSICLEKADNIAEEKSTEKSDIMGSVKNDVIGGSGHTLPQSTTLAQHAASDSSAPKITNEIALSAPESVPASSFAPAPEALAQTVFDSGSPAAAAQPDYANTYARVAMQQGMPAIRSAQTLLAAASAVALPLANAATGSSNVRSPASLTQSSIYIPPTSSTGAAAAGAAATSASEVTTASTTAGSQDLPTGIPAKSRKASRTVASAEVGSRSQSDGEVTASSNLINGGQTSRSSASSGSSSGSAGSGSYTPTQGKRRAANVDREEQKSILQLLNKPESYRVAKKKLDDTAFVQKLKDNGIAIFRNDGTVKGDPSGSIKYSDKGNRFVRED